MSEPNDPRLQELQAHIKKLPPIVPRPEFREQARREFTGEVAASAPVMPLRPAWRRRVGRVLAASAAAAAVLLVFFLRPLPDTSWSVVEANALGYYTVDGVGYRAGDLTRMTFKAGTTLTCCPMGAMTLKIPGEVVFQLGNATSVTLERERQGLFGSRLVARIDAGRTFGTTGPEFSGMRVSTKESEVVVHGTTFAVISEPDYTCVCLLEGDIQVTGRSSHRTFQLSPLSQYFVYGALDGPPESQPLPDADAARLLALRDAGTR